MTQNTHQRFLIIQEETTKLTCPGIAGRWALLPVAISMCFAEYLNLVPSSWVTSTSLGPTIFPSPSYSLTPALDSNLL